MILPPLLAISPGDHGTRRDLTRWLRVFGRAGLPGVVLREPHLHPRETRDLVHAIRPHLPLVILHVKTPGAHTLDLPLHLDAATPPHTARGRVFGVSCHDGAELDRALGGEAAYALLSPVWRPVSKPDDTRPPLGPETFLSLARERPVFALGGVTPQRAARLGARGATHVAVMGGLFDFDDPQEAVDALRAYLEASS